MTLCFAPNLGMLYAGVPFLDRFARAAAAGFGAVEFPYPFEVEVGQMRTRVDDLGLSVVLLDLHMPEAIQHGTVSEPSQRRLFRQSLSTSLEAASRLKCKRLNVPVGCKIPGLERSAQLAYTIENLLWAAPLAAQAGVTLLVEPLNPIDFPDCLLHNTAAALEIITQVGHPAVKLQYDVYHAQMSEGNILNTIAASFPFIGHIQVADVPGRCEPGSGEINFPALFATVARLGYKGCIGLEYQTSRTTDSSFRWLPKAI